MLNTVLSGTLTTLQLLMCAGTSVALGFVVAFVYMFRGNYSKSFVLSLVLLPLLVQVVIMMVGDNLGAGVAVMGAFSLVRFRSAPGSSKEIATIFLSMSIGLMTGSGYLLLAAVVTVIASLIILLLTVTKFGNKPACDKDLRITIPETLDYTKIFDDLFETYTLRSSLETVKTTNLGTMYELRYSITLRDAAKEKAFIDALRCRNGNLPIICGRMQTVREEL